MAIAIILAGASGLSCQTRRSLPRFAEYLKAEQEVRRLVVNPPALQDSLAALALRMSVDRDRIVAWLDGDPGRWNALIGLLHEKP